MSINDELYDAIAFGEKDAVVEIVQQAVNNGDDIVNLLNETMIPALREVGDQFSRGEVFVPEMLVSARAMQAGVDIIDPLLALSLFITFLWGSQLIDWYLGLFLN